MILLEFAAQGVRGVAPAGGRATLRPGYNVVAADGAVMRRLLEALVYPDPRDADALPRAPGGPAGAAMRAGLTLVGNDKVTYRLVRDFAAATQLHRFDAEKRSFALVSQDLKEIGAFLQRTVGVPAATRLSAVLALSAAELPSKQGGGGLAPSALSPARTALTPEQAKRRVAALKAELEKARVAEKLQAQQDGLQARAFKVEERLRAGLKLREGLAAAEIGRVDLDGVAAALAPLGEDAEARLAAFEKVSARRAEATAKVAAEREALEAAETQGPPTPPWRDPIALGGAAAGVLAALVGAIGASSAPGSRYVALLDVPAFGVAAWRALRWVGALERWERVARRKRVVDDWERKVETQFEKDAADVKAAMQALRLDKTSELREALGRVHDADAVVAEWRSRLAAWEASPEAAAALAEKGALDEELRALEAKLGGDAGGFVRDVRSVEQELQRVEAEAAAPAPAAAAAPPPPPPRPTVPAGGSSEPLRALLERAAAELGGSPSGAGRTVAQKASQALAGLTFQRLSAVQVDDRGGVQVVSGGRPVPAITLPAADKDLVYLSLKLAFLEQALAAGKVVAVVDDAFGGLSDGGRRFAARLLKQIARPGQLVHATSDAAFREAADHVA